MAHFDVGPDGNHEASFPTSDTTPESSIKKPRLQRSKIWEHFTIQKKNPERANCNYCGADLGCKDLDCYVLIIYARTKESHFFKDLVQDTYGSTKGNVILTATHKEFVSLFGDYQKLYGTPTTSEITSQSETSQNASESSLMRSRYNKRMRLNSGYASTNIRTELDKYLAEDAEEPSPNFDILSWWKCNSARFPVLSKLARDILAIPISTAASESAFSTSGRILDDFRSSLTPMTLQALICTQDWLREKRINIEVDLAELTKLEEEFGGLQVDDDEIISVD